MKSSIRDMHALLLSVYMFLENLWGDIKVHPISCYEVTWTLDGAGWLIPHPDCLPLAQYTLYRSLGAPQGQSGQMRKMLLLLGFTPRSLYFSYGFKWNYMCMCTVKLNILKVKNALVKFVLCHWAHRSYSLCLESRPLGCHTQLCIDLTIYLFWTSSSSCVCTVFILLLCWSSYFIRD